MIFVIFHNIMFTNIGLRKEKNNFYYFLKKYNETFSYNFFLSIMTTFKGPFLESFVNLHPALEALD
jgi:hypothetical protein